MKYFKKLVFFVTIITCFVVTQQIRAQNIPQNLSNINVNDLSDAQIRQIIQQAQTNGLTDIQILAQAQSRGMTDEQTQALQKRIADIRKKDGTPAGNGLNSLDSNSQIHPRKLNYVLDTTVNNQGNSKSENYGVIKPQIFGADLFSNKNMKFEPNLKLATPLNYIIGPEDQLLIYVYGKSVVNWKLEVNSEGNINIPGLGLINVSGKTIEHATMILKTKLSEHNYGIGNGTTVEVSLGNIRGIKVTILGQVTKPGTYTLPSLATVFNALYTAGGPNENGSLREIAIIRNNKIIRHLDVYDFLIKGDQKNNIGLQDQDVIQVPTYRNRVELSGEVKIPGLFEILPGESLADVLKFAGGFNDLAYTARIKVIQINDQQKRITDVIENDYKSYTPLRGDKYIVERVLDRFENRVWIAGAVFRPGQYELQKGLTLSGLIANAAGLKEDAFNGRGNILRLKSDNTREVIPFNIKDIIEKKIPDIILQREDSVHIVSLFDLRDKYGIIIKGEVRRPGNYPFAEGMTVEDLIIKSGGFAEGASAKHVEVARRIDNSDPTSKDGKVADVFNVDVDFDLKNSQTDFKLKPYDIIVVHGLPGYEKQKSVKVEGEVLYPGYYAIENKTEKVSDLIKRAGGLSVSADIDGGTLRRSNIAILGAEKNKADTLELAKERLDRLNRLKKSYKDSTNLGDSTLRNNYVGIDLKQILDKPGSDIDLLIEDGDVLRIPKKQQIVRVNGEVLYPSAVVYNNNKTFKDYILNAGGYSPRALKRGAYIVYANGTVKGTSKFLFFNAHPEVKPGSEIIVPKKPEPKADVGQQLLSYSTGLVSLLAIIIGIIRL